MGKTIKRFFFAACVLSAVFIIADCGDDAVNLQQDFVSGTVTYNGTSFFTNGGYYAVSVYADVTNPFSQQPVKSDSVEINTTNGTAYYNITGLATGNYYIGATWIRTSNGQVEAVVGTYGCDTVRGCNNHIKVEVPRYQGTGNLNFYSWADLSKKLYP
jgi:hypothetical protein